jgi:hypothetical protein
MSLKGWAIKMAAQFCCCMLLISVLATAGVSWLSERPCTPGSGVSGHGNRCACGDMEAGHDRRLSEGIACLVQSELHRLDRSHSVGCITVRMHLYHRLTRWTQHWRGRLCLGLSAMRTCVPFKICLQAKKRNPHSKPVTLLMCSSCTDSHLQAGGLSTG